MNHRSRVHNFIVRIAVLAASLACSLVLCGSIFFDDAAVTMDTETHPVYQHVSADGILQDFERDPVAAKDLYYGKYYITYGKITSKSKGKVLVNGIDREFERALTCKAEDQVLYDKLTPLQEGDTVKVYGRLMTSIFNGEPSLLADDIVKSDTTTALSTAYTASDGTVVNTDDMELRVLGDGAASYYVPASWQMAEHNIKNEALGKIEGYQYRLNETENQAAYAESLFIGCVTKSDLVSINDLGDDRGLEEAIAADILGKDSIGKYPVKTVNTYYGPTYRYYQDIFETSGGDRLNTEFIFQDTGDDHLLIFLYVYRDPRHLDEIMTVLRLTS